MPDKHTKRIRKCADDSKKCGWCGERPARLELMIFSTCRRTFASRNSADTGVYITDINDHWLPICLGCGGSMFDELRGIL